MSKKQGFEDTTKRIELGIKTVTLLVALLTFVATILTTVLPVFFIVPAIILTIASSLLILWWLKLLWWPKEEAKSDEKQTEHAKPEPDIPPYVIRESEPESFHEEQSPLRTEDVSKPDLIQIHQQDAEVWSNWARTKPSGNTHADLIANGKMNVLNALNLATPTPEDINFLKERLKFYRTHHFDNDYIEALEQKLTDLEVEQSTEKKEKDTIDKSFSPDLAQIQQQDAEVWSNWARTKPSGSTHADLIANGKMNVLHALNLATSTSEDINFLKERLKFYRTHDFDNDYIEALEQKLTDL